MKDCCKAEKNQDSKKGLWQAIALGILPHSFCIGFIVFTIIGSTLAASFFKKVLLVPYFFELLVGFSFLMALISAVIYLKKIDGLSLEGVKKKWKYLSILFGVTIGVNLLLFNVVFPAMANGRGVGVMSLPLPRLRRVKVLGDVGGTKTIVLEVKIPCSGHASLITGELKKLPGVKEVVFTMPNIFTVNYNPGEVKIEEILGLLVFKSYPATIK